MSEIVLDLGAGTDPDDRATHAADLAALPTVDAQFDLDHQPWPLQTSSVDGIVASHVFEHLSDVPAVLQEAARVLRPSGWLELDVPVGRPQLTDPTHENHWTWSTPAFFARGGARDYYFDLPFKIVNRNLTVWFDGPLSKLSPLLRAAVRWYGPGDWVSGTPWLAGTLTVRFRRVRP